MWVNITYKKKYNKNLTHLIEKKAWKTRNDRDKIKLICLRKLNNLSIFFTNKVILKTVYDLYLFITN